MHLFLCDVEQLSCSSLLMKMIYTIDIIALENLEKSSQLGIPSWMSLEYNALQIKLNWNGTNSWGYRGLVVGTLFLQIWINGFDSSFHHLCAEFALGREWWRDSSFFLQSRDMHCRLVSISELLKLGVPYNE